MTGLPSETVYTRLAHLEAAGWLKPLWETVEPPSAASDPSQRLYSLSEGSAAAARRYRAV